MQFVDEFNFHMFMGGCGACVAQGFRICSAFLVTFHVTFLDISFIHHIGPSPPGLSQGRFRLQNDNSAP